LKVDPGVLWLISTSFGCEDGWSWLWLWLWLWAWSWLCECCIIFN